MNPLLISQVLTTRQYVGEEGSQCLLKAAISVGNPFDLELSNKALQRSVIGHHVYQRVMGSELIVETTQTTRF